MVRVVKVGEGAAKGHRGGKEDHGGWAGVGGVKASSPLCMNEKEPSWWSEQSYEVILAHLFSALCSAELGSRSLKCHILNNYQTWYSSSSKKKTRKSFCILHLLWIQNIGDVAFVAEDPLRSHKSAGSLFFFGWTFLCYKWQICLK